MSIGGGGAVSGPDRQRLRGAAALVASAALLAVIFWRVDPARLWSVLRETRLEFVALSVASSGGALVLVGLRWHWMLCLRGMGNRLRDSIRTTLIGFGLTLVLPGALFADVAKSYDHSRRHQRPLEDLLVVCALDRFAGALGLACYGVLVVGLTLHRLVPGLGGAGFQWKLPMLPAVAAVGVVLLVAAALATRSPRVRRALDEGRTRMRDGWNALRVRPGLLVGAAALSVAGNLMVAATLAFGLASVAGGPIPWDGILWTLPVIGLAAAFPFTVGGAGTREGAAISLWSACGIVAPIAVGACLVTLAANLVWASLGGLLLLNRGSDQGVVPPRE